MMLPLYAFFLTNMKRTSPLGEVLQDRRWIPAYFQPKVIRP